MRIVVHELGSSLPGALAGSHLGSIGADVFAWRDRNEPDWPSRWGWDFNKSVRWGPPSDAAIAAADIVIDGRRLGSNSIVGPRVVCRILGDWNTSIQDMPELIAQSATGLVGYVGRLSDSPIRIGAPIVMVTTGLAVVQACLAGLIHHRHWETACSSTVTAVGAGLALLGNNITAESDPDARESFAAMQLSEPIYGFACTDGIVDFSFYKDDDGFAKFCEWLGRADIVADVRFESFLARVKNATTLNSELRPAIARRNLSDVVRALEESGAVCSRRYQVTDLVAHPQLAYSRLLSRLEMDDRSRLVVQVPFLMDGLRPEARGAELAPHEVRV